MSMLPPSATVKIIEMINICVQRVLNIVNSELSNIYVFRLFGLINPIPFLILAAMLCAFPCVYNRCTECHALYFKPMVLPFPSPAFIIIAA